MSEHELAGWHRPPAPSTSRSPAPTSTPSSTRSTAAPGRRQRRRPARATITGEGITPLHAPRPATRLTRHLDRLGRRDRAHRLRRPGQHDPDHQLRLAPRARATFPVTGDRHDLARAHAEWRVDGGSWNPTGTADRHRHGHAHARHRGRRLRRQPQRDRRSRVNIDNDVAGRHDGHRARRLAAAGGRPHGRRHRRRTPASTTSSGRSTRSRPAPARTARSSRSARRASTSSRPASSTRSATSPRWRVAGRLGRHQRPDRHHRRSRRPGTRPRRSTSTSPAPTTSTVELTRIEWKLGRPARRRRLQPGNNTVPVDGHRRRRARARGPHDRRRRPRPGLAHAPGQDRHGHPDRPDDGRRPAGCRYASLNVNVHGTDAHSDIEQRRVADRRRQRRQRRPATAHDVTVSGDGVHTLETRVDRQRRPGQRLGAAHDQARRDRPDQPHAGRARRAGATRPTRSCSTARTPSPASPASSWKVQLEGEAESGEHVGAAGVETATINQDGTHTLSTRVRDIAGTASGVAHRDHQDRPRAPDRQHDLSDRAGRTTATSSRSAAQDDRSGVAAVEWKLDGGDRQDRPLGRRSPATATTRSRCASATTPATGAPGSTHTITVVLADRTRPRRPTTRPIPTQLAHRRATRSTWPRPTTSTASASTTSSGADRRTARSRTARRATRSPSASDGIHSIETRVWDKAGNHTDWKDADAEDRQDPPVGRAARSRQRLGQHAARSRFTRDRRHVRRGPHHVRHRRPDAEHRHDHRRQRRQSRSPPTASTRSATASTTSPASGRAKSVQYKVDTVNPVNTSAAAPTTWQTPRSRCRSPAPTRRPASITASGASTAAPRRPARTAVVDVRGHADASRRASSTRPATPRPWRPETIKVDHTAPTNTTRAARPRRGRKTDYARTVTGTDASPACQRVEYSLDGGATQTTPRTCRSPPRARTRSRRRIVDVAGNASDWRTDTIGIDRTVPTLAVDCGTTGWRNSQADVLRRRDRRALRPGELTADGTTPVVDGAYTVAGAGRHHHQLPRRRRRRQRDDRDRPTSRSTPSPPAPAVKCVAGAGTRLDVCTATASDAHLRRRQPGLLGRRLRAGRDRQRRHVRGRARARSWSTPTDVAGNAPRPLRSRSPIARLRRPTPTPRTEQRGRAAAQGRRVRRAPGRSADDLVAADRDARSTCGRSRSARAPSSSSSRSRAARRPRRSPRPRRSRPATRRGSASRSAAAEHDLGRAHGAQEVRQALGHLRHRRRQALTLAG